MRMFVAIAALSVASFAAVFIAPAIAAEDCPDGMCPLPPALATPAAPAYEVLAPVP